MAIPIGFLWPFIYLVDGGSIMMFIEKRNDLLWLWEDAQRLHIMEPIWMESSC